MSSPTKFTRPKPTPSPTAMSYLKFPDLATAQSVMSQFWNATTGKWILQNATNVIDPIGTLYTVATFSGTTCTSPATAMTGWHMNILGPVPANAVSYVIVPANPKRKFAGH